MKTSLFKVFVIERKCEWGKKMDHKFILPISISIMMMMMIYFEHLKISVSFSKLLASYLVLVIAL